MNSTMTEFIQTIIQDATPWATNHGIKILLVIIAAYASVKYGHILINRLVRTLIVADQFLGGDAQKKRENTLNRIFASALRIVVWMIAILIALQELGFSIGPLLAAAGIVGLAFGFGGQYLIRDLVSGLFIIMENQYRINDVVCFDGTCGLVEDITLRMTTLRDLDGVVHHVPHGEIKKVSNLSKNFARVNLNIGVSYSADLEKVISVINRVGNDLAADPVWKDQIIKAPQFLRVDDFGDSAVIVKILGETQPIKQWDVTGELRKRIKIAFDKDGIEIPFPQRVVHHAKSSSDPAGRRASD